MFARIKHGYRGGPQPSPSSEPMARSRRPPPPTSDACGYRFISITVLSSSGTKQLGFKLNNNNILISYVCMYVKRLVGILIDRAIYKYFYYYYCY